jgi:RNA-directed DNA polymerase
MRRVSSTGKLGPELPGKGAESRPSPKAHCARVQFALTVPTMKDRAQRALHLLALDPAVETTADHNPYGFRQQRSCADAIKTMFQDSVQIKSAVDSRLEGDINSCFDRISHDWLLAHVPMDRAILQEWLKSGYLEKHVLHETTDGTPQGGRICAIIFPYKIKTIGGQL